MKVVNSNYLNVHVRKLIFPVGLKKKTNQIKLNYKKLKITYMKVLLAWYLQKI